MNQNFEGIESPDDENTIIWRYMDFAKFMSMIEEKALFFADYETFDDPSEGRIPKETNIPNNIARQIEAEISKDGNTFVNCWHMDDVESVAMWNLYSDLNKGIAIKSTYKNLYECLSKSAEKDDIEIGIVNYDPLKPWGEISVYRPFIHKRPSFKHERELRAILHPSRDAKNVKSEPCNPLDVNEDSKGIQVHVSLDELINEIYISPKAHIWSFFS